jgi:hypothetical protein
MISIYWICFLLGGVFVLFAVLGGIEGVDFDHGIDLDPALDSDIEMTEPGRNRTSLLGLLRSFKFWTFGLCFFGLTGISLSGLGVSPPAVLAMAISVGLAIGGSLASILRLLYHRHVDSLIKSSDLIGCVGTVELPFDCHSKGKVRLELKGVSRDFIALTDAPQGFELGDPVLVIEIENNLLWVVSAHTIPQEKS